MEMNPEKGQHPHLSLKRDTVLTFGGGGFLPEEGSTAELKIEEHSKEQSAEDSTTILPSPTAAAVSIPSRGPPKGALPW
jgi:hypothetical protein